MKYVELFSAHIRNLRITSSGQSYGRCCFHQDKCASFSVNLETGCWTCHSGCGSGGPSEFERRVGETPMLSAARPSENTTPLHDPSPATHSKKIVKTYRYQNQDGVESFQVVRFEPKSFAVRRWADNNWKWGLDGVERVPYNLPAVLKNNDKTTFFVEGEKDADRLISLGLVATTTPLGANSWSQSYAKWFSGKRIVCLPDNDKPGEAYANLVARDVSSAGCPVKIVRLPGLAEKGDTSDFLDIPGNTVETILSLVKQSPLWSGARTVGDNKSPAEYFKSRGVTIHDGTGILPDDFTSLLKETYRQVTGVFGPLTDRAFSLIGDMEKIWNEIGCQSEYKQCLKILVEVDIETNGGRA